jgi:hypothetical protein
LRKQLQNWQLTINDRGFEPESDIIKTFWPNLVQPTTADVVIETKNQLTYLNCKTNGASIAYQRGNNMGSKHWLLYSKPIQLNPNEKIRTRAIRIGYKASNITTN